MPEAPPGSPLYEFWIALRSLYSWFFGGLALIFTCVSVILFVPLFGKQRIYGFIQQASALILQICGIRLKIIGREQLDLRQPYLYMANHVNLFDSLFLVIAIPQQVVGVEKDTHFSWPVYGALIRKFNIPVSQANSASARTSLQKAVETFNSGVSVVLLPEGTRTRSGQTGVFKKGGFHLAIDAGATIAPMTFKGAYAVNATPGWKIRPGTVEIIFHAPISTAAYTKDTLEALRDRVRATIVAPLEMV